MVRIVKLTFQEDKIADFLNNFNEVKHQIRSFDGNQFLELLSALRFLRWENVTYSGVSTAVGYLGYIGNIDRIDFSFTPAVATNQFFQYSRMKALGNLNFSGSTTILNIFEMVNVFNISLI